MIKNGLMIMVFFLYACTGKLTKSNPANTEYFSDASDCIRASERKEYVKVPTGLSFSVIEIPLSTDAETFRLCMKYKGHPVTTGKENPSAYLSIARACLQAARKSSNPDRDYAHCVGQGKITVETIPPDK